MPPKPGANTGSPLNNDTLRYPVSRVNYPTATPGTGIHPIPMPPHLVPKPESKSQFRTPRGPGPARNWLTENQIVQVMGPSSLGKPSGRRISSRNLRSAG